MTLIVCATTATSVSEVNARSAFVSSGIALGGGG
jgi:hypothetical protein